LRNAHRHPNDANSFGDPHAVVNHRPRHQERGRMMKTEKQAHYFPHNTHETVQIAEKHRVNEERELIVF
jgi:2,3-bisphosphoglycerate-independent phosphoglycerate mutase